MTKAIITCDICGQEISERDAVKPDGRGGLTNLYDKYPRWIRFGFATEEAESLDLCIYCAKDIFWYMKQKQFSNMNKEKDND